MRPADLFVYAVMAASLVVMIVVVSLGRDKPCGRLEWIFVPDSCIARMAR